MITYYALTENEGGIAAGLFRAAADGEEYRLEYLNEEGDWVLDYDLAKYLFGGELGAESIDAGGAQEIAKRIAKKSDKVAEYAFCPTGEDGGIDNSCPPASKGTGGGDDDTWSGGISDERLGMPAPKPGEKFIVYRLARNPKLENDNAANADGLADYIMTTEDIEKPQAAGGTGKHLLAFEVTVGDQFGDYQGFISGRVRGGFNNNLDTVGRKVRDARVIYSFPSGAKYTTKHLKTIPLDDLYSALKSRGFNQMDDAGTKIGGEVIRELFRTKRG